MAIWKKTLLLVSIALFSSPALAQQGQQEADQAAEQAYRVAQQQQRVAQEKAERQVRAVEAEQRVVEVQMREAEERLAQAARKIAELSTTNLPGLVEIERRIHMDGRPVLGITIAGEDDDGPVEGVEVRGVSPGGAAADAGLQSGDIITAVNDESLTADHSEQANAKLVEFMSAVEEGDVLDVEYLRDGKQETVELAPKESSAFAFAFGPGRQNYSVQVAPHAPNFDARRFAWVSDGSGWGHMEMVSLTERLGKYFGTDKGLLVVRAPEDESLKLEDGDVIQSIDGREPNSVSHAMRILGSYQSGEELELEIMRDKRKQKVKIEMPDNRSSWMPHIAPGVAPDPKVIRKVHVERKERT